MSYEWAMSDLPVIYQWSTRDLLLIWERGNAQTMQHDAIPWGFGAFATTGAFLDHARRHHMRILVDVYFHLHIVEVKVRDSALLCNGDNPFLTWNDWWMLLSVDYGNEERRQDGRKRGTLKHSNVKLCTVDTLNTSGSCTDPLQALPNREWILGSSYKCRNYICM